MSQPRRPTALSTLILAPTLLLHLLSATSLATSLFASEPETPARATFERLKTLAGSWQAESTKGWSEEVVIEVIARGSVVMSTTLFEEGRKMVTMYSLDGERLVATHYCEARNQPHLVASQFGDHASSVLFEFERGGNLASRDQGHMDSADIRFVDDRRFASRWTWYQDGKETWMEEIEYRRIR